MTTADTHLRPAEARCSLTTDPVALNLFRQLREMDDCDRRFVLRELDGSLRAAISERIVLVRSAMRLFVADTGEALSKKRYERWRLARADRATLPSATFVANTWNGSWSTAMDKLGFEPAADHAARRMAMIGAPLSDGALLEHLRVCAAELGATPGCRTATIGAAKSCVAPAAPRTPARRHTAVASAAGVWPSKQRVYCHALLRRAHA